MGVTVVTVVDEGEGICLSSESLVRAKVRWIVDGL